MNTIREAFRTNPYLMEFQKVDAVAKFFEAVARGDEGWQHRTDADQHRHRLWRTFAYAVPTGEALELLARYAPILEIGAGSGYWASLLRQGGVEVAAFDKFAIADNEYFDGNSPTYTKVERGSDNVVRKYPGHTLFLCCPPPNHKLALNCLNQFCGKHVAIVGDVSYCATVEFYQQLADWDFEAEVILPRFPGYDDSLTIYTRHARG